MAESLGLPVFGEYKDGISFILQCQSIKFYTFNTTTTGVQNTDVTVANFNTAIIFQLCIGSYRSSIPFILIIKGGGATSTTMTVNSQSYIDVYLQISYNGSKLNLYSGSTNLRNFDSSLGLAIID